MPAILGTLGFHLIDRPPHLPQRAIDVYQSAGHPSPGVRLLAPQSAPDTVTTTRYLPLADLAATALTYQSVVGGIYALTVDQVAYDNFPIRHRFLVLHVEIISQQARPRIAGLHINGQSFTYAPAGELIARWTLLPVPLD